MKKKCTLIFFYGCVDRRCAAASTTRHMDAKEIAV